MYTILDILKHKRRTGLLTISPEDTVFNAIKVMAEHHIGALLVMEEGRIRGIITERDYARKVILENRSSRTTSVSQIMSTRVLYIEPEDNAEACMALMIQQQIRYFPVLSNGEVVGIISIGDLARAILSFHEFVIDQLTDYITQAATAGEVAHAHPERLPAKLRIIQN
ncbi:MAG: CBS domain-containing protein [Deltaproteobacteria bacterium]|nr:CBS domain-containing protein [Deltaproteobacteria bacterium]